MSSNSIPQGNTTGSNNNFLKTVGGSFLNVGVTIGGGAMVGGGIGKLASLTPYKPKPADLELQYKDMFQSAIKYKEAPDYIKNAGDEFVQLFKKGRKAEIIKKGNQTVLNKALYVDTIIESLEALKSGEYSANKAKKASEEIRLQLKKIPGLIKKNEDVLKLEDATILERLRAKSKKYGEFIEKRSQFIKNNPDKIPVYSELEKKFVEKAGSNERIKELATKGAKHVRNKSIIGIGIAAGVVGALVLNILKTYGVLKFKLPSGLQKKIQGQAIPQGAPINVTPEMIAKVQAAQEQGQIPSAK